MGILSDIFAGGTKGVLEGVGVLAKDIRAAIPGEISPEKKAEIEQKLLELESASEQAQAEINKVEASHPSLFVAGWRPFIGWVCGAGLAYHFLFHPLLLWAVSVFKLSIIPPILNTDALMGLVSAMLGLGGMRMWEKFKGVAREK